MEIPKTKLKSCDDFIGNYYVLLNLDGSILARIKINHCKVIIRATVDDETDHTIENNIFTVSGTGAGWYRGSDRIETK